MDFTTEKLSGNKVKLSFTVPAEDFDAAMQKAYLKTRGRINVPGFRKGKAPRKLIESMYGEGIFYDEAFDAIFPDVYQEAITKGDIHPVDKPELDLQQIGAGQELKFSVEVFVLPDVTLGDYKKLKATKHLHPITQEEIDHRISHDVDKATTQQDVTDRAAQAEDTVTIDYLGRVDGVAFDGGTAQGQKLELGSNTFIPGFEDQVIGMEIGQEKDINVTFPAEYHAENLAGKEAVFTVKLHGITSKLKPELDDEFAADVSAFTTFKEYKDSIEKELTELRDKNAQTALENDLIRQATDQADCDIPDAMINDEIDAQLRNMKMRMAYQGISFEDYIRYTGQTEEQIRDMIRPDAQNSVKTQLVIDAIGKAEKIEPSQEDIDAQIDRHAEEMGRKPEEYRKTLNERQLGYYKDLAASRQVVDILEKNADISLHEGPEEEDAIDPAKVLDEVVKALPEDEAEEAQAEEKPAKKPAPKKKVAKEPSAEEDKPKKAAKPAAKPKKKDEPKEEKPTDE